jgi:hypothetical protein
MNQWFEKPYMTARKQSGIEVTYDDLDYCPWRIWPSYNKLKQQPSSWYIFQSSLKIYKRKNGTVKVKNELAFNEKTIKETTWRRLIFYSSKTPAFPGCKMNVI